MGFSHEIRCKFAGGFHSLVCVYVVHWSNESKLPVWTENTSGEKKEKGFKKLWQKHVPLRKVLILLEMNNIVMNKKKKDYTQGVLCTHVRLFYGFIFNLY